MYFLNPELQRNIWLELTPHRLIAAPLVLGAILFLASFGTNPAAQVASTASFLYVLVVFIWGSHRAAEAVIEEVNQHTWDFQRLSPVSPWVLTVGKLLGSTVFTWYAGGLCLIAYFLARLATDAADLGDVLAHALVFLVFGLMAQAIALLLGVQQVIKSRGAGRRMVVGIQIVAFMTALSFFITGNSWIDDAARGRADTVLWHGITFPEVSFLLLFGLIFLGWVILGIYRLMCEELKAATAPWAWLGFMVFMMFFLSGFELRGSARNQEWLDLLNLNLVTPYFVALFFVYALVLVEPKSMVTYRRLWFAVQSGNLNKALQLMPLWAISFVVFVAMALLLMASIPAAEIAQRFGSLSPASEPFLNGVNVKEAIGNLPVTIMAVVLFLVRDIGVYHYFNFSPSARRADFTATFYLLVVYVLIPRIFDAIGAEGLLPVFMPFPADSVLIQTVPVLLQAGGTWFLVLRRLEKQKPS